MRELADATGFPGSFHQRRRVFATVAAGKVSIATLSKVLGHKKQATTTDLYAHLYAPAADDAMRAVADAIFGSTR
jgi:integrase